METDRIRARRYRNTSDEDTEIVRWFELPHGNVDEAPWFVQPALHGVVLRKVSADPTRNY